jgi:hypothetical protein
MRILRNSFYTTLVGSLVGATALAATPLRPSQIHKEVIDQSLAVAITPRGQNFFTLHLDQILADNGYALDQGEIENWKYQATQPIQLQSLPVSFGDTQTTLGNLRQIIEDTLRGFTLNDPQPIVNVNGIQYAAQFSHFGLRVDPRATASLTRANSVVVDLEIEIPNMSISAESIIANDPKNPGIAYYTDPAHPEKIKNWGMNNFSASVAPSADSNGKPVNFRFKVPMEVSIDSRIGISVRALNISTNLPLTAIDWTFAHPLVYPQFDIESGGQVVGQISFDDLEKQINATKTKLAQSLAVYLKTYLTENGAQMINQALTENHFTSVVEDVNEMTPLGAPVNTQPTSLLFGMIPEALKLNQGVLTFQSKAYAEDPSVAQAIPLSSPVSGSPEPDLSSYNTGSYDIALSVNEAFLNRLLQLSFERG